VAAWWFLKKLENKFQRLTLSGHLMLFHCLYKRHRTRWSLDDVPSLFLKEIISTKLVACLYFLDYNVFIKKLKIFSFSSNQNSYYQTKFVV
jgi:hypothetical protein